VAAAKLTSTTADGGDARQPWHFRACDEGMRQAASTLIELDDLLANMRLADTRADRPYSALCAA
jgi:hypothetical protein